MGISSREVRIESSFCFRIAKVGKILVSKRRFVKKFTNAPAILNMGMNLRTAFLKTLLLN